MHGYCYSANVTREEVRRSLCVPLCYTLFMEGVVSFLWCFQLSGFQTFWQHLPTTSAFFTFSSDVDRQQDSNDFKETT